MEHALILAENACFTSLFVGFLEEKVVGLEDFVGSEINAKVVNAAEVAENWADPRMLGKLVALPNGIQGDDAVELEHGVFFL